MNFKVVQRRNHPDNSDFIDDTSLSHASKWRLLVEIPVNEDTFKRMKDAEVNDLRDQPEDGKIKLDKYTEETMDEMYWEDGGGWMSVNTFYRGAWQQPFEEEEDVEGEGERLRAYFTSMIRLFGELCLGRRSTQRA